jgi:hypothetical protein
MRPSRRPATCSALLAGALLTGCLAQSSPSPAPTTATPTTRPSAPSGSLPVSASPLPTATPKPALTLDAPPRHDDRRVRFTVTVDVKADGDGEIQVDVENLTDTRIDEIVLRWPTELAETLYLAPFTPTEARVREGGKPLHYAWTKWVVGPGELGEPAGTTSVGWGPLLPRAKLSIPLVVTRRAPGPVAFDVQLLAGVPHVAPVSGDGDALLSDPDGEPAQARVEVP